MDDVPRWQVARSCSTGDLGTQVCRLPLHLAELLDAVVGDPILIDFGNYSVVGTVHILSEQQASVLHVARTIRQFPSEDHHPDSTITSKDVVLPFSAFKLVRCVKLTRVTLGLVLETYAHVKRFNKKREYYLDLLQDALSPYVVTPGCRIDCRRSDIFRLLNVAYVTVSDCHFSSNGVGQMSGRIDRNTAVSVGSLISHDRYNHAIRRRGRATPVLGGLDGPRRLLEGLISYSFRYSNVIAESGHVCPRGVLLAGPPGVGKTALVLSVTERCGASLIQVAGPALCRSEPGESEALLRRTFAHAVELSEEGPCVLFVDEVDSILGSAGAGESGFKGGQQVGRLLAQILTLMDGLGERGNLVVIGATNRPQVLDAAVRRPGRFDREIYLGAPTKDDRERILELLTTKLALSTDVNLAKVAEWTPGFVGADLVMLCQEVISSKIFSLDQIAHPLPIAEADFIKCLKTVRPSTLRDNIFTTDYKRISWDDIGGLADVKKQLIQAVEWPMKHRAAFLRLGLRQPRGVLLYGPPGCCKTTLVRACATSCNSTFLHVSSAQIYSSYLGDSEKAIAEAFQRGRIGAPTILFLDEIEAIVGKRDIGSNRGVHEKVLSTLLNEMDGIGITVASKQGTSGCDENKSTSTDILGGVMVIAATNRPDLLDDAILRPGRFDKMIYVPPPDATARLEILQVLTRKMPVHCNLEFLVQNTKNFTGADLKNLCLEAIMQALTDEGPDCSLVRDNHFITALTKVTPSVSPEQLLLYEKLQQKQAVK